MPNQIVIHCQPSLLEVALTEQLNCEWSLSFGKEELDVIVDDIAELEDDEVCKHYGLDYDLVNSVEAYNFTP